MLDFSIRCRRLILVIGALLSLAVSVHAGTRDGYWWVQQSESTKIFYVLGSIDRTMLTGSIDMKFKLEVVGAPEIGEIVSHLNAFYYRPERRPVLVQTALPLALYEISQLASSR